jgi:hypothetical protein
MALRPGVTTRTTAAALGLLCWLAAAAGPATAAQQPAGGGRVDAALAGLPTVARLPPGTVRISPVVPGMGEHWANPRDLPLGPVYCVIQGRVVCAEFMIAQEDFEAGRSFPVLEAPLRKGRRLPALDHLDVGFEPHGHPGFAVPHYDLHMYFIGKEDLKRLTRP